MEIWGHSIWVVGVVKSKTREWASYSLLAFSRKVKEQFDSLYFSCGGPGWEEVDHSPTPPKSLFLFSFYVPSLCPVTTCQPECPVCPLSVCAHQCLQCTSVLFQAQTPEIASSLRKHHSASSDGRPGSDTPCPECSVLLSNLRPALLQRPLHIWGPEFACFCAPSGCINGEHFNRFGRQKNEKSWRGCSLVACFLRCLWVFCLFMVLLWLNDGEWHIITLHGRENISQALVWIYHSMCVCVCVCICMHS